ncbi:DUF2235 domain-containing protein [Bradyrhizobium sp. WSM 1791]|uniref:DUF2235 domain-containing protein n=1 Tax=Bradyrhizobium australiense TaxID=2721161 RepID=A0A7Y4GTC8_9BRAD|nr:DUF2235 domain-containing protein [Bradyrhizobium australiense]
MIGLYEPGDPIYLIGFSRGAYTVRSVAGVITYCGIPTIAGRISTPARSEKPPKARRACGQGRLSVLSLLRSQGYQELSQVPP